MGAFAPISFRHFCLVLAYVLILELNCASGIGIVVQLFVRFCAY
ncbi:hypothetical protein F934_00796 [Acinetobacter beijerinckii ANC 3835]|uniref:Uncharacterized protein n=1 Tax=Acinetobacter beijerinckii ANC 3835 TaxID=1217649 RepID=N9FF67_9GAMM|nr:hypothetical protein F934_00796 [Acinetobacter beijerinckii ANC 3835]